MLAANPEQFRVDYALSREGPKNKRGGKMYSERRMGCQAGVGWGVGLALGVVWCGELCVGALPSVTPQFR